MANSRRALQHPRPVPVIPIPVIPNLESADDLELRACREAAQWLR